MMIGWVGTLKYKSCTHVCGMTAVRDEKFTHPFQRDTHRNHKTPRQRHSPVVVWAGSVPLSPLCGSIRPVKGTYISISTSAAGAPLRETVLSDRLSSTHPGKRFTLAATITNRPPARQKGAKRPREVASGRVIHMRWMVAYSCVRVW